MSSIDSIFILNFFCSTFILLSASGQGQIKIISTWKNLKVLMELETGQTRVMIFYIFLRSLGSVSERLLTFRKCLSNKWIHYEWMNECIVFINTIILCSFCNFPSRFFNLVKLNSNELDLMWIVLLCSSDNYQVIIKCICIQWLNIYANAIF